MACKLKQRKVIEALLNNKVLEMVDEDGNIYFTVRHKENFLCRYFDSAGVPTDKNINVLIHLENLYSDGVIYSILENDLPPNILEPIDTENKLSVVSILKHLLDNKNILMKESLATEEQNRDYIIKLEKNDLVSYAYEDGKWIKLVDELILEQCYDSAKSVSITDIEI